VSPKLTLFTGPLVSPALGVSEEIMASGKSSQSYTHSYSSECRTVNHQTDNSSCDIIPQICIVKLDFFTGPVNDSALSEAEYQLFEYKPLPSSHQQPELYSNVQVVSGK
jgi:hypothetical protein